MQKPALTVGQTLANAKEAWPENLALVIDERQASYDELWNEVHQCALALIAAGIKPRSNVGIYLPNCWEYIVLFYAINLVGACAVALNARLRERELLFVLRKADVCALFTSGGRATHFNGLDVLRRALPELDGSTNLEQLDLAE